MENYIFLNTKLDLIKILKILVLGIGMVIIASYLIMLNGSLWWLILMFLGLLVIFNWSKILIKGKITIGFMVKDEKLYTIYNYDKKVKLQETDFSNNKHNTIFFDLQSISNFWHYTLNLQTKVNNKTTQTDKLNLQYKDKKETIIDLADFCVKIANADLVKLEDFLKFYNPSILFSIPAKI